MGTSTVARALQVRNFRKSDPKRAIGAHIQLLSWHQSSVKASTPSVPGQKYLELNFATFLFSLSAIIDRIRAKLAIQMIKRAGVNRPIICVIYFIKWSAMELYSLWTYSGNKRMLFSKQSWNKSNANRPTSRMRLAENYLWKYEQIHLRCSTLMKAMHTSLLLIPYAWTTWKDRVVQIYRR